MRRWRLSLVREVVREAVAGLQRNRVRAGLSTLGISWGIVSVVVLLAWVVPKLTSGNDDQPDIVRGDTKVEPVDNTTIGRFPPPGSGAQATPIGKPAAAPPGARSSARRRGPPSICRSPLG